MKIAVVGIGKIGSKIKEFLSNEGILFGAFDKEIMKMHDALNNADASIVFVPGAAAESLIPILLNSKKPVVWGGTGYTLPDDFHEQLVSLGIPWIYASNYSIGMNIAMDMLRTLSERLFMLNSPEIKLHEIHHINKKDAPSGTALTWKEILNHELEITSNRIGDVVGTHRLMVTTDVETICLEHKALDRSIFAQGAIWACKQILKDINNYKGLIPLKELINKNIKV